MSAQYAKGTKGFCPRIEANRSRILTTDNTDRHGWFSVFVCVICGLVLATVGRKRFRAFSCDSRTMSYSHDSRAKVFLVSPLKHSNPVLKHGAISHAVYGVARIGMKQEGRFNVLFCFGNGDGLPRNFKQQRFAQDFPP